MQKKIWWTPSESKRHNLPWITHKTRKQINRKHKLFQRAKKTNKEEDWENYREIKRITQKETRQSQWNYVNNMVVFLSGLPS
jgi:hypothetical protein